MVLGVVCGLRKEYTTLGKWLKAWVRSTLIWFLTPTCSYIPQQAARSSSIWYTWNVPCIFALRSYMFKNWCFKNKLLPEYSVYNLVSLCVLLEHCGTLTRWNANEFVHLLISNGNLCSIKDNLYTHKLCVFITGLALFVGISRFI